jgi:hypothetical protein
MTDRQFLRAFEMRTLPFNQWTHRAHVKVAFLYLRDFPFDRQRDPRLQRRQQRPRKPYLRLQPDDHARIPPPGRGDDGGVRTGLPFKKRRRLLRHPPPAHDPTRPPPLLFPAAAHASAGQVKICRTRPRPATDNPSPSTRQTPLIFRADRLLRPVQQ